jgi:hypothetical protein
MKNHNQTIILIVFLSVLFLSAGCEKKYKGPITKQQAIEIAEREWGKAYKYNWFSLGEYRPYKIEEGKDFWKITGQFHYAPPPTPDVSIWVGGEPHITIRKSDGVVLEIFHTK